MIERLRKLGWKEAYQSSLGQTFYKGSWVCKVAKCGLVYFFRLGGK